MRRRGDPHPLIPTSLRACRAPGPVAQEAVTAATPQARYEAALRAGALRADPHQAAAAERLGALHADLTRRHWPWQKAPAGLYLHGRVGRGKSMLMDMFHDALPPRVPSRRVHFHAFMGSIHADLHARRRDSAADNAALLPAVARGAARGARVLCLDELHVRDIADAMILGRLTRALWRAGVTLVTTSNAAPEDLYRGGLQRELFEPFIGMVRARMDVVTLDGDRDHRQRGAGNAYFCPLSEHNAARSLFETLGTPAPVRLDLPGGRALELEVTGSAAWVSFAALCEQPRGAADYLALAHTHGTVFIDGVPRMGYDRRNEAHRFQTLIDVLYDAGTRVAVVAAAKPGRLHTGDALDFARTASRLAELAHRGWDAMDNAARDP